MAIDQKYGRVETEFGSIGDSEPVVVLRGRDEIVPHLLELYAVECMNAGSPQHHIDLIRSTRDQIAAWQRKNGSVMPTSDAYMERINKRGGES